MDRDEWKATWSETMRELAEQWNLTVGPPFPGLTINFAAPANRKDGVRCVLKICSPRVAFDSEVAALEAFDGRGVVRLLDVDRERRAMLLQRAEPGASIRSLPDAEATAIAARAMRRLWGSLPDRHPFPTLADWSEGFERHRARFGGRGPIDRELFEYGSALYADLISSQSELIVLHGDLHHDNLVSSGGGWLAIDPQGVIGERAHESASWLRNPHGLHRWPDLDRVLQRRIEIFSETFEIHPGRVRDWAVAQTVLSMCWSIEDDTPGWRPHIEIARRLRAISI